MLVVIHWTLFSLWVWRLILYAVRICWLVTTSVSFLIYLPLLTHLFRNVWHVGALLLKTTVEQFISRFSCDFITLGNNDVELLVQYFNNLCSSVLDEVAPLKSKSKPICNASPWVMDVVRSIRRSCRRTERLWKSTGLEVHCLYLKELMQDFNNF